jgi:AcrR family transcriptional regulator
MAATKTVVVATERQHGDWSPNQQAARLRIADAAATLVARTGLGACTVRAVADEAGLTKSTVHYYVHDANELVDLAVLTCMERLAAHTQVVMDEAPDGPGALCALVRMFLHPDERGVVLEDRTLWAAYTAHAFGRGAHAQLLACFEIFSALFESALDRCDVSHPHERGRSIYHYLLGAVQRNMVQALADDEVARAVSALSGISFDSIRRGLEPASER